LGPQIIAPGAGDNAKAPNLGASLRACLFSGRRPNLISTRP